VVAENHQHHRGILPQAVCQFCQAGGGVLDGAEVVVQNIIGALLLIGAVPIAVPVRQGIVGIGAVALVADGEVEIGDGGIPGTVEIQDVREEDVVHGKALVQSFIAILEEPIPVKAQVTVHVPAVVEVVVAGVAALGGIALLLEVPGAGIPPEIVQGGVAGEESPLRLDGASGKNIGNEIAGKALCLQGVILGIDLRGDARKPDPLQIVESLQLDADDVHLPVRRDVLRDIGGEDFPGSLFRIALRLFRKSLRDAVEEGIDESFGEEYLGGGPLGGVFVVPGFIVVNIPAGIHLRQGNGAEKAGDHGSVAVGSSTHGVGRWSDSGGF
jgi:hypothetical protein